MNTQDSVEAIMKVHPQTSSKDWKRRLKYIFYDDTARVFENVATKQFCTVYCLEFGDVVVKDGNLLPKTDPELMKRLIKAGNSIKHCGDYGQMFWNPLDMTVWMCMGDGDCPMENEEDLDEEVKKLTSYEDVKKILLEAGAKTVLIEAEHSPSWDSALEDERGGYDKGWGKENDASIHAKWWQYIHIKDVKGIALELW